MISLQDEKNIDSIFFYAINNDINHLGFWYTSGYNKYKFDYKDANFKDKIERLKYVYNILKNEKQINLIGELTNDIMNNKIEIKNTKTYNKTILNNINYDFNSMIDYIKYIINHTLRALSIEHVNPSKWIILGNKEKYFIRIPKEDSDETKTIVPITFYKDGNNYKFDYKILRSLFLDNNNFSSDVSFSCTINCFDKSIIVQIDGDEYKGEVVFDRLNIVNAITLRKNNDVIYYYSDDTMLLEEDINKIQNVFKIIDFNGDINGIKTMDNNYILYSEDNLSEYKMKLNIHDELVRINLKMNEKYLNDGMDFKFEDELYDFIIIKLDDNKILIQQKYVYGNNANSDAKKNSGKSRYYILTTEDKITSLSNISTITNRYEIEGNISNIEDFKNLVLK